MKLAPNIDFSISASEPDVTGGESHDSH
jgi:hypothetical protein